MSAVGVVVWKELRETLLRRGRPSVALLGMVAAAVFLGVLMPTAVAFLAAPSERLAVLGFLMVFVPIVQPFLAFFSVGYVVVDTIAGERERNTMPTLLATPLPNASILLGKLLPVLALPVANLVLLNVLAFATLTVLYGRYYHPPYLLMAGALAVGVLVALLAGGIGVLISMGSGSVKQGQQLLGYLMLPLPVLLLVPDLRVAALDALFRFAPVPIVALVYLGGYLLLLGGVHVLAFRLFTRDRLMRA